MHHFVAKAEWSDTALLAAVRQAVRPGLGAIEAWIVDDTGYAKKGTHSVGVARQDCGPLGKQDNCQVAVSVSVANERSSVPIGYQLYLPRERAEDAARRKKTEVPRRVGFATQGAIALEQLRAARDARVPVGVVLADAGYGNDSGFRLGIRALGLTYAVGIQSSTTRCGPKATSLCHRERTRDEVFRPSACAATARISRSMRTVSPTSCRAARGVASNGAKAPTECWPRASRAYG